MYLIFIFTNNYYLERKKKLIRDILANIIKLFYFFFFFWLNTHFSDSEISYQFKWVITNSFSFKIWSTDSELIHLHGPFLFSHARNILQEMFLCQSIQDFCDNTHIHKQYTQTTHWQTVLLHVLMNLKKISCLGNNIDLNTYILFLFFWQQLLFSKEEKKKEMHLFLIQNIIKLVTQ